MGQMINRGRTELKHQEPKYYSNTSCMAKRSPKQEQWTKVP